MLVLALADPLAALAGSVRGPRWRVPGGRKSLWGSVAFLATALGLGALFEAAGGGLRPLGVTVAAVALTLVEAGAGFGLDNLLLRLQDFLARGGLSVSQRGELLAGRARRPLTVSQRLALHRVIAKAEFLASRH